MTFDRQLGLLSQGGDELRSALHVFESVAGEGADVADGVQTQIGELALRHVAPDVFDRIECRRVRGESFQDQGTIK